MNTASLLYRPARVGGRLVAALLFTGLQLSLVLFPFGSVRAGENEERNAFTWKNLQSDIAGVADRTDPNLVNSWGLTINTTANIFWISDNGTGVSTVYRPDGSPVLLGQSGQNFVTLPPTLVDKGAQPPTPAAPTGIAFNLSKNAFLIPKTSDSAVFLFDGEDGGIWAWSPAFNLTNAFLVIQPQTSDPTKNSVYKGLALANRASGGPTLYATNFRKGTIDVFDSSFKPVTGGFVDPNLPANYAPFGIASIDNLLYVTFALQNNVKHDDVSGVGHGFVDVFTPEGVLIKRLIPFTPGSGHLNSPWGLARVPRGFGKFGHDVLLVGNFGDGTINAFDINTGNFIAPLENRRGEPLDFNGLWALFFFDDKLYFTAGIGDETHGLFGVIRPVEREEDSHE
jgi:uncharacterized protein (TIGR03118 family)